MWRQAKQKFWDIDPGFMYSKQATRSVLAILITTALLYWTPVLVKASGGLMSGLIMQGIYGQTHRQRQYTMLISGSSIIIMFILGSLAAPYHIIANGFLVVSCFFVFYVRRFGTRFMSFPLYVWLMGLIGTILPSPTMQELGYRLFALCVGFSVSFIVYFYLIPSKKIPLFFSNLQYFFLQVETTLLWLEKALVFSISQHTFQKQRQEFILSMHKTVVHNQNIAQAFSDQHAQLSQQLNQLLIPQFVSGKSLIMLMDSIQALLKGQALTAEASREIAASLNYLAMVIRYFHVDTQQRIVTHSPLPPQFHQNMDKINDKLYHLPLIDDNAIIYLFNLSLSYQQLWKNLFSFTEALPSEVKLT